MTSTAAPSRGRINMDVHDEVSRSVPSPVPSPAARKPLSGLLKFAIWVVLTVGVIAGFYFSGLKTNDLKAALRTLNAEPERKPDPIPKKDFAGPWNGLVSVAADQQSTIGFNFATVKAQTEPLRLELNGRTAYDPNTLTKITPRFDVRVEKVFAETGNQIKVGDPLVLLYSTDLAAAKSDYQIKYVQWQHDLKLYRLRQELVRSGAISQQAWVDTQNDELKSRLDYNLALDKLVVMYEVPKNEIDPLIEKLGDDATDPKLFGSLTDKAKITMRSKTNGIVIERLVVEKNLYETSTVLMVIAPLDHLWVWLNVYELDQDKVKVGQTLQIQFPFLSKEVNGEVSYVANEVSKDTRAVQVRATIPNPDGKLKADMLVKAMLEIAPVEGHTVIPRLAMVALDGADYAFVRLPRPDTTAPAGNRVKDQFERRKISIEQENTDHVVVSSGLRPGEVVVTNGSLILSQLYEDQQVIVTGSNAD